MIRKSRKLPLELMSLVLMIEGCAAVPARVHVGEKFSAEEIYAHRQEFATKIIRAEFVWHYGFEKCDVLLPAEGGGLHFLQVDFDEDAVRAASPKEWEVALAMRRQFNASFLAALKDREKPSELAEFTMRVDADVEVILPRAPKKDVIELGPDLTLKVFAIHSIHEEKD